LIIALNPSYDDNFKFWKFSGKSGMKVFNMAAGKQKQWDNILNGQIVWKTDRNSKEHRKFGTEFKFNVTVVYWQLKCHSDPNSSAEQSIWMIPCSNAR
jgi:hypothetical protein